MTRRVRPFVLLALGWALFACAGDDSAPLVSPAALEVSPITPEFATSGALVELLVDVSPRDAFESGSYTLTATGLDGAAVVGGPQAGSLSRASVRHRVRVQLPSGDLDGRVIRIQIARTRAGTSEPLPTVEHRIRILTLGITAAIRPLEVEAAAGGVATATVSVTPISGWSGTLELIGIENGSNVTPRTITIAPGQTTASTATVSYGLPATATPGSRRFVSVSVTGADVRQITSLDVFARTP